MNMFEMEVYNGLRDLLYMDRAYQSLTRYQNLLNSHVVGVNAQNRMVQITVELAHYYNCVFHPVTTRYIPDVQADMRPRLVRK